MIVSKSSNINVLVIAHPDDESMFFLPTINSLRQVGATLFLLCLTTGNYDGLGKIRQVELHKVGLLLGFSKITCLDTLQDHPTSRWPVTQVSESIQNGLKELMKNSVPDQLTIITFDSLGVSGHVNHIDTHLGVCELVRNQKVSLSAGTKTIPVQAWLLKSEQNFIFKYFPVWSWFLLLLSWINLDFKSATTEQDSCITYQWHEPHLNWKAMAAHHSQFVWYRRLFVIFSKYTYVNTLVKIKATDKKYE